MKVKKSQAALEFLTTYAWAFLVILITVGALYYFGVFDFQKFLPQECVFPFQFRCIDSSFVDDQIRFRLLNDIGETIQVTSMSVTNDATPPLSCTPPANFQWNDGDEKDFTFTSCSQGGFIKDERVEAEITIEYYAPATPSQPRHNIKGRITAILQ